MRAGKSFIPSQSLCYTAPFKAVIERLSTQPTYHKLHPAGYDCSGLTRWAYYKAFGDVNNGATGTQVRCNDAMGSSPL